MTRSLIDSSGDAASVDAEMRAIEGSAYALDTERLATLDPDLVVTQGTCDVCAVATDEVDEAVASLDLDAEVLSLDPHSVEELLEDVRRVAAAVGREARGETVAADLRARLDAETTDRTDGPRTLVFDWTSPPMLAGHWVPGLVARAGGRIDRPVEPPAPSVPVEWSWVRAYDPEAIVVAPCGFETPRALGAVDDLRARDGWDDLAAVRRDAVYAADGSGLFNRPGPRLVETLSALRACLDPARSVADADGVCRATAAPRPAD